MTYKKIRFLAIILVIYGILNLFSYSNFSEFTGMMTGFPKTLIVALYGFGILYGMMSILCGMRMVRLEDWARRTSVVFVLISLASGLLVTPRVLKNLKGIYAANAGRVSFNESDMIAAYVFFAALFTFYEIMFVYFFTRVDVKEYFNLRNPAE
ncbi:MAG: hypothetical protein PHS37_05335 [Candidatus Omnitrophica bacterium]|nr:hypothetical protein [Candidatus Omnitrophota bacterium]